MVEEHAILDLVIIGGGPTGINVGVEAEKAGLDYLIIEKGLLANSIFRFPANMTFFSTSKKLEIAEIPFISHQDKPTRREALEYYRRIVESYKLNIHYYEGVNQMERDNGSDWLISTSKDTYRAENVVVATGFYDTPRMLNVPGEDLPKVKHFYDEAHPYVGQNILVIGGANSGCDVALETWQKGAKVTLAVRQPELYEKVKYWILPNIKNRIKEGAINAHFETIVKEIKAKSVVLHNEKEGQFEIENDFVLAMTGYKPDYDLLKSLSIPLSQDEYLRPLFDEDTLESPLGNVYIAGVLNAGLKTSTLFIENTRHHAGVIISHILSSKKN